jgi:hypothetical protein
MGVTGSTTITHKGVSKEGLSPVYVLQHPVHVTILSVNAITSKYGGSMIIDAHHVKYRHAAWGSSEVILATIQMHGQNKRQYIVDRGILRNMLKRISTAETTGNVAVTKAAREQKSSGSHHTALTTMDVLASDSGPAGSVSATPQRFMKLDLPGRGPKAERMKIPTQEKYQSVHELFGHASKKAMITLLEQGRLQGTGITRDDIDNAAPCTVCTHPYFRRHISRKSIQDRIRDVETTTPGTRMFADIKGPLPPSIFGRYKYFLMLGDKGSQLWVVKCFRDKGEGITALKLSVRDMYQQLRIQPPQDAMASPITVITTDHETMFVSAANTSTLLNELGVVIEPITTDMHAQNPAESLINAVSHRAMRLLEAAKLNAGFWNYAVIHAVRCRNELPNGLLPEGVSPRAHTGQDSIVTRMFPFGAHIKYTNSKSDRTHNMNPGSGTGACLGLTPDGRGYIILDIQNSKIVVKYNVLGFDVTRHLTNDRFGRALNGEDMTDVRSRHAESASAIRGDGAGDNTSTTPHKEYTTLYKDLKMPVGNDVTTSAPRQRPPKGYEWDNTLGGYKNMATGALYEGTTFKDKISASTTKTKELAKKILTECTDEGELRVLLNDIMDCCEEKISTSEVHQVMGISGNVGILHELTGVKANTVEAPKNINRALNGAFPKASRASILKHIMGHMKYGTFNPNPELIKKLKQDGVKPVGVAEVFAIKPNPEDGSIIKLKFRLCARGDQEKRNKKGENDHNTYNMAGVASDMIQNVMIAVAVLEGKRIYEADVEDAYLQSRCEQPKIIRISPELADMFREAGMPIPEGSCELAVIRNFFGFEEAAGAFSELITAVLKVMGFITKPKDECLFKLVYDEAERIEWLSEESELSLTDVVSGYVLFRASTHSDDLRLIPENDLVLRDFLKEFRKYISMKEVRQLYNSLGAKYERDQDTIRVSCKSKIEKLEKIVFTQLGHLKTPTTRVLPVNFKLERLGEEEKYGEEARSMLATYQNAFSFRSALMTLLWLARMVRWDVLFATIYLSSTQAEPTLKAYEGIIHIANYLISTKDVHRIMSPDIPNFNYVLGSDHAVNIYADTDLAGCPRTGRSFMCVLVCIKGIPVHFVVRKQSYTRISSVATELKGLTFAAHIGMYANEILLFLDHRQHQLNRRVHPIGYNNGPFIIYEDNAGAISNSNPRNPVSSELKHVRTMDFHVKELVKFGYCKVLKIPSKENPADIGTKDQKFYGDRLAELLLRIGLHRKADHT